MAWPNPLEVAEMTVNGNKYTDWETVQVKHAVMTPFYTCKFTCSEPLPVAKNFGVLQIKPGDDVSITLGGQLAFSGLIYSRQVYYDKQRHYVELSGVSFSQLTTTTSVSHPTMEFKKVTLEKFIRTIINPLAPWGVNFKVIGGKMPTFEFPRINVPHGMTIWEAIDRHSRPFGINYTSDADGNLVAIAGQTGGSDSITEGKDILIGREIIFNQSIYQGNAVSSKPGNNKEHGAENNQKHDREEVNPGIGQFFLGDPWNGQETKLPPQVIHSEITPWTNEVLKGRNSTERGWSSDTQVTVFGTVQGWMRPSGGLWQREQQVEVTSPMLIMDHEKLKAKSVTFTQDTATGTRTTLELCNEAALRGSFGF